MTDPVLETLTTGLYRIDRPSGWCKGELVKGSHMPYHAYCALGALLPVAQNNYQPFDDNPVVVAATELLAKAIAELYPNDHVVQEDDCDAPVALIHRFNDSRMDKAQIVRAYRHAIRAATTAPAVATESELATAGD